MRLVITGSSRSSVRHRPVALKVLPADVSRDPQRRTRFAQEAHAAFAALDRAVKNGSGGVGSIKVDLRLESLRSDPRFAQIVRRVGLPV